MRLEADKHADWKVVDASTGQKLTCVTMLDDVTKEMESLVRDADGRFIVEGNQIKRTIEHLRAVHIDTSSKTAKVYRK